MTNLITLDMETQHEPIPVVVAIILVLALLVILYRASIKSRLSAMVKDVKYDYYRARIYNIDPDPDKPFSREGSGKCIRRDLITGEWEMRLVNENDGKYWVQINSPETTKNLERQISEGKKVIEIGIT